MEFLKLIQSLDGLLYEILSWLLPLEFLPHRANLKRR